MSWRTWTPNASTSAAGDVLKHVGLSAAPDAVNAQLLDNCRPLASCLQLNGASDGRAYLDEYAIIVIGAGSGGLTAAEYSAAYGVRVLLIESKLLGGDCLHTGCVPSKTLLNVAKRWKQAHETLEAYGAVESTAAASGAASETAGMSRTKDLCSRKVLERLRASRSIVSRHDSFASLSSKGVDVLFGDSVFTSANSVAVNGVTRKFKRACIATGSRPYVPPDIPGLSSVKYFTSDTFFNQDSLPARLAVVGGGPVACELAQAFAGTSAVRVTLSRGAGGRGANSSAAPAVIVLSINALGESRPYPPLRVITSSIRRNETSPLSRVKSTSYGENLAARRAATEAGADEALMLNLAGRPACLAMGNIFLRTASGDWVTPPADEGVREGYMRGQVLARLAAEGCAVHIRPVIAAELLETGASLFGVNSLWGMRPVQSLDGHMLKVIPSVH